MPDRARDKLTGMKCPRCHGIAGEILLEQVVDVTSPDAVDAATRQAAAIISNTGTCAHITLTGVRSTHAIASGWVCTVNPPRCRECGAAVIPDSLSGPARCIEGHNVMLGPGATGEYRLH